MWNRSDEIRSRLHNLGYFKVKEMLKVNAFAGDFNILLHERPIIDAWVEEQDHRNDLEFKAKQLGLADESNKIAKDANKIANEAKNRAYTANWISIVALAVSIVSVIVMWIINM